MQTFTKVQRVDIDIWLMSIDGNQNLVPESRCQFNLCLKLLTTAYEKRINEN